MDRECIFIDGAWVSSAGQETIDVFNPATETRLAKVPRGVAADVDRAVEAAARALPAWAQTSVAERARFFRKLADVTEARAEEITRTIVSELGYPMIATHKSQTLGAVDELRIMAECVEQIRWSEHIDNVELQREPAGIVGAITAWNGPLRSVISKAGAAIAAGCTVVCKGSEVAPLTSFIFAEMADEAGLPPGVFNLLCGTGPEVGEAITAHPLVDMVSLTGSVPSGQRVMEVASRTVKRVHLELGGKSANIVFDDADFERAVTDGVHDAFRNTGQVCGGLTRLLVPRERLAEAEQLAVACAEGYVLGDPFDETTTLGPVATDKQRERVLAYIQSGLDEGVRLLTGGMDAPVGIERGYFVLPTVFSGDNSSRVAREEIFGPVIVITPFADDEEAIAIANDSPYGLAAGIWSADTKRARNVAARLRVGRIRINGAALSKYGAHGGFKLSGIGREWGRAGIEEFLEYKSIFS